MKGDVFFISYKPLYQCPRHRANDGKQTLNG